MPTLDTGYFDTTGGTDYAQDEIALVNSLITSNGYVWGYLNACNVIAQTPPAMAVDVDTGFFFNQGYWKNNHVKESLNIDAAHATKNRIDRIICRVMPVAKTIEFLVLKGTDYVGTPVAPTLTRTAVQYECSLAQVYVGAAVASINQGNITWEGDDYTLCGAAHGMANVKASILQDITLPKLNGAVTGFSQAHGTSWAGVVDSTDNCYVIGGLDSATYRAFISKFDHTSWTTKTPMSTARSALRATYYDGNIYCIGGLTAASTSSKKNEAYNIAGDSITAKTDKTTATHNHGQALCNGIIYCFGGITNSTYVKTSEAFDCAANTWAAILDLPSTPTSGKVYACADELNGLIYVHYVDAGGNKFYVYDTGTNTYTVKTAHSSALINLFFKDGNVYGVVSGATPGLYRYDTTLDTWYTISSNCGSQLGTAGREEFLQLSDRRYFIPGLSGTNAYYYTHYYYLSIAASNSMAMFRSRSSILLQLMNITTNYSGEMVGLQLNDLYGLYVNDISATSTGYTCEIMG